MPAQINNPVNLKFSGIYYEVPVIREGLAIIVSVKGDFMPLKVGFHLYVKVMSTLAAME